MNKRIRQIRKSKGLTQTEFGTKIGVKGNTITNYESGLRNPSDAIIKAICREFHINENWLRTGEGGDENMFLKPQKNDLISKAAILLGEKDPVFEAFVETYSKLTPSNRKVFLDFGMSFLENLNSLKEND